MTLDARKKKSCSLTPFTFLPYSIFSEVIAFKCRKKMKTPPVFPDFLFPISGFNIKRDKSQVSSDAMLQHLIQQKWVAVGFDQSWQALCHISGKGSKRTTHLSINHVSLASGFLCVLQYEVNATQSEYQHLLLLPAATCFHSAIDQKIVFFWKRLT